MFATMTTAEVTAKSEVIAMVKAAHKMRHDAELNSSVAYRIYVEYHTDKAYENYKKVSLIEDRVIREWTATIMQAMDAIGSHRSLKYDNVHWEEVKDAIEALGITY